MAKGYSNANTFNGPTISSPAGDPALPSKPNEGSAGSCEQSQPVVGTNSQSADPGSGVTHNTAMNNPRGTRGSGTAANRVGY